MYSLSTHLDALIRIWGKKFHKEEKEGKNRRLDFLSSILLETNGSYTDKTTIFNALHVLLVNSHNNNMK